MDRYAGRGSDIELLEELGDLIDCWRFGKGFRAQRFDESGQSAQLQRFQGTAVDLLTGLSS